MEISLNAGGSIVPSGDYVVAEGSSVTYNIVPQADYKITSVIVDGKNIGAVLNCHLCQDP